MIKKLLIFSFVFIMSYSTVIASSTLKIEIINKVETNHIKTLVKLETIKPFHIYWNNPGEVGEKTKLSWEKNSAKLLNFSSPKTLDDEELIQYIQQNPAYYLYELPLINKPITLDISWIACGDECVPEKTKITFNPNIDSSNWETELKKAKETFPKKVSWKNEYKQEGTLLEINIKTEIDLDNINYFNLIPIEENIIDSSSEQIFEKDGENLKVSLETIEPKFKSFSAVLELNEEIFEIDIIKKININIKEIISIIIMAFIGGIILNLMPCILPILTIKALNISKNTSKKEAKIESLSYMLGVVSSFLIIASILIILRINGEKIGWGFQLQSPVFTSIMLIIFTIIALMFLDLIVIKNPFQKIGRISNNKKRINSFATGAFAVLIASPCSAPFMGVAIGYSLTQSIYIYYPIFLSLSIGYALPFTIIGFYPAFIQKILPKTGKWMIVLKKVLSIPIILTCIWLAWILYNQINIKTDNVIKKNGIEWQDYNEENVLENIKNREGVFINFSAKWCITCLTNKKMALDSKEFEKFIKENQIKTYLADWTKKDDKIAIALETYKRNSVPLYVYYPKNSDEYIILPQILTTNIIKDL